METVRNIFKIGYGPSSSHTMAPRRAAELFKCAHAAAVKFNVTLYGSLAATGKGHLTDKALLDVFGVDNVNIIWEPKVFLPQHPNGIKFEALNAEGQVLRQGWQGGGS